MRTQGVHRLCTDFVTFGSGALWRTGLKTIDDPKVKRDLQKQGQRGQAARGGIVLSSVTAWRSI